jgi:transcription elongation factor GreA
VNLADALSQYLSSVTSEVAPYAHQELHRFGRTIGLDRRVDELAPPEIAGYAESVVAAGGDIHGRLFPLKEFLTYLKKGGFSSHSLAPHVKIPRATARAVAASRAAESAIPMTKEGVALLREELDLLKGRRGDIIESIKLAAADKDFRENAPLDAARENQGKAEARIRELEETLRYAVIMVPQKQNKGVQVGSTVVLQDLASKKNVTYKLTDSADADPSAGRVSISSPVGQAMLGANEGDEVAVMAPKGERRFLISSIKV